MKWPWRRSAARPAKVKADAKTNVLYLFPDTNLFIQCKWVDEINWSAFAAFDEVRLVVSRPVQKEIDNHKNRGHGRVTKRARKTAALFKEVVQSASKHKELRPGSPRVTITLRIELRPGEHDDRLDLDEADDRLVAITQQFARENAGATVRLLTHDSGPTAAAHMVGLSLEPIPDDWLLPAEAV